jgi:hypothetical protein
MLQARRLIFALSTALAVWVLASFAGTMLDPIRSAFWTSSLMWALLTSLLLSPALLVVAHYVRQASGVGRRPADVPDGEADAADEAPRIWPEPRDPGDEPSPRGDGSRDDAPRDEWPWTREDVERPE